MGANEIKEAIKNDKLIYTCKCGWIDKTHANPKSSRPTVGPASLWNQIVKESGIKPLSPLVKGFRVAYRQDAVLSKWGMKLHPGVTKEYLVSPNLSLAEKESVALAIFKEVSFAFEDLQKFAFWSDSSFANGDLVSNLLAFYSVVRPGWDYLNLCGPITKKDSLQLFEEYPNTFSKQSHIFFPVFYDCRSCSGKGPFPPELQQIVPSKKGKLFSNWSMTYEWPGGVSPLRGPKF